MSIKTIDPALLKALGEYDSATIQNAAIYVRGYMPAGDDYSGPELRCMLPEMGTVVGYAMTAEKTVLCEVEGAVGVEVYYDSIAYTDAPTIAVMQDISDPPNRGALWGDEMAHHLAALGCVAGVIGGCVRDVAGTKAAGCGLWATGRVPGHGPCSLVRHGVPVTIGGLRIESGDILVCDAEGITRVPVDIAVDVVNMAEKVRTKEQGTFEHFKQPDYTIEMYKKRKLSHGLSNWPVGTRPPIPGTLSSDSP